ncbi:hypothetical protein D9758_014812 [Tetrapyrgos nigripes]|uniref:Alpha-type protein kinase domain-containing protein n=1 Tax=Tetrapyrgos nigripes TaxID=182062 RepID=A0A8H5C2Q1_9AGAR|nr:hypothetical protein D9758_014812 [Tetrapyrgos nigripes]
MWKQNSSGDHPSDVRIPSGGCGLGFADHPSKRMASESDTIQSDRSPTVDGYLGKGLYKENMVVMMLQSFSTALSWNSKDAFLTKLTQPLDSPVDDDNTSLVFNTFLVVPLLDFGGLFVERKFSGNNEVGKNDANRLGQVMDAFAHHVIDDSNGEFVFADIQGLVAPSKAVILFDPQAHT